MISRDFCREQIARLYQLKGYPRVNQGRDNQIEVKAALRELLDAIQGAATEKDATDVISGFVIDGQSRDCPLPVEIRRAVRSGAEDEYQEPGPTKCNACSDTGWRREWAERRGAKYEVAVVCACRRVTA